MAMIRRGDPSLLLQPDWTILESEDNSLRATLFYKGDRRNAASAPIIGDQLFTGHTMYCYERRLTYNRLQQLSVQCDYIGIERDPSPYKVEFPGGSGTEPIESHPNFAFFAGTPANPKNGAIFDENTNEFLGFGDGNKQGVRSYIVPDVRVNLNYWTFRTPNGRRVTKEISYRLPDVVPNSTVLNYLLIGLVYRKFGELFQVTEQWLGSGPRGWDRQIY